MKIDALVKQAKRGAADAAAASTEMKDKALARLMELLTEGEADILAANQKDVAAAGAARLSKALIDRLALSPARIEDMRGAAAQVMSLPDPTGMVEEATRRPGGLEVGRMRVPLGLIAFICEARPGAIVEAAVLALKSGNGIIIKAGKEVAESAAVLGRILAQAFSEIGPRVVTVLPTLDRDDLKAIIQFDEYIDLVIPRGGESLIRFVSENSRIPVLKHFKGICHVYVDEGADLDMAADITVNSKAQRPSTCNSLECLLVHESVAQSFLPKAALKLKEAGVRVLGEAGLKKYIPWAEEKSPAEIYGQEFLDLVLAVRIVPDMSAAMEHIAEYGSNHTEVIITRDYSRARFFVSRVDASCVMVNASTRLNDGGCLGLGAEMGISTTKLHAYGPMGLKELTTRKFVVMGSGQTR